jgi:hypothetical protein
MAPRSSSDHAVTVAERLDIDLAAVPELSPFTMGSASAPKQSRGKRRSYWRRAELDRLLQDYAADAEAGVPDTQIASRVRVTKDQVKQWRRRHGIQGKRGRPPPEVPGRFIANALLGRGPRAVPHRTSPVQGRWDVPEYVLRQPLDYGAFMELVAKLADEGFSAELIARGMGVIERDVHLAAELYFARRSS